MKRYLTTIILLIIHLTVFGQHQFGVKANAGLSKISNSIDPGIMSYTNHFGFSGSGGLFYNFQFSNQSVLGVDLLFSQMEGVEEFSLYVDSPNVVTGHSKEYKHISYLSLPIYYGLKFKRFTLNVGFQASLLLTSGLCSIGGATVNGEVNTWEEKYDELNIDSYDFGPRAGISYNITDRLSIEATYYYGLNNITDNEGPNSTQKIQQAVIGLRYAFFTSEKNEIE